jgi:thiamine-phosphate pyrophosphorylase
MHRRHPVPTLWLMTDERLGEALWSALERLPRGSGVVFRDHATPPAERRVRFARVLMIARRRRLVVLRAGSMQMRGEMGAHNARARRPGLCSRSVHDGRQAVAARRAGADLVFVSPVFSTRSHPGAHLLGPVRLGLLLRSVGPRAVALGGINRGNWRRLNGLGLHGWAAIDGLA